MQRTLLAK